MKTKAQKIEQVKETKDLLNKSKVLVFADFTGTDMEKVKELKKTIKPAAKMKVVKKNLLKVAMKESGFDFDPKQFESQLGTIFSDETIDKVAGPVYKFAKTYKDNFKILGAYDIEKKTFVSPEEVTFIGTLPSREILLAQVVGMLSAPIKMFLYILSEKGKVVAENK